MIVEINITKFFNESCPRDYSASMCELGNGAADITWRAAVDDSEDWMFLDDDDKRDQFRVFVRSSGGWSDDEIAAWSNIELNALLLQWIAGDIREGLEWDCNDVWANYQEMSEAGQVNSNLCRADDGQIYWTGE
jgi:hypothetical protein